MKFVWALAAGVMLGAPAGASAAPAIASGNELLQACRGAGWDSGYCYGFILGVYRGVETYGEVQKNPVFCPTDQVTVEQAVLVVQQYMLRNPKIMDKAADLVVAGALIDAFPCK